MSELSTTEIDHLAKLARLELNPEEKTSFQEQLPKIVDFVSQLTQVKEAGSVEPATYQKLEDLREDVESSEKLSLEEIEKLAPYFKDGQIVVPPVLAENPDV